MMNALKATRPLLPWLVRVGFFIFFSSLHASDFTWTAGNDVAAPLLNSQDADAGLTQDGPNLSLQTALYPCWSRYRGTHLDDLVRIDDATRDASFNQPNGDDAYWTNGIWQDEMGKRHAIVHIEYNYAVPRTNFLWKRRIGFATSTDQGASWHYEGDILTTNPARPGAPDPSGAFVDFGCGDTYLFVDRRQGYFYLYYMTAWVYSQSGWRTAQAMNVARCPIASKMAPGAWRKWKNGAWSEPGLGGLESPVFSGTDSSVVHFNTYLNAFVAIGHDSDGKSWVSTCRDLATQVWAQRDYSFPQRLYWYNWPVDPVTHDRYEIGQTFRLYSAQANVDGKGTKYFPITFSKNGNAAPSATLISPEENDSGYAYDAISLIASAKDPDGKVAKLEFFANQVKLGEATIAPYVFAWKNVPPGNYRLSVRATDNLGAATESAGVNISVQALTYETWKSARGLADDSVLPSGLSLLMSYALNIDSAADMPVAKVDTGLLTLTYPKLRSDISYLVERSTDFSSWTANQVNQGTGNGLFVTASTPLQSDKRLFLRLRVTHL